MIIKNEEYSPIPEKDYQQLLKERVIKSIQYRMGKLKITTSEISGSYRFS